MSSAPSAGLQTGRQLSWGAETDDFYLFSHLSMYIYGVISLSVATSSPPSVLLLTTPIFGTSV